MKLYVNEDRTKWVGTQAEAKKEQGTFEVFDVPVDKTGLLEFLNREEGFNIYPEASEVVTQKPLAQYPVENTVSKCSRVDLTELSTMLRQLLFKTWGEMEVVEDSPRAATAASVRPVVKVSSRQQVVADVLNSQTGEVA